MPSHAGHSTSVTSGLRLFINITSSEIKRLHGHTKFVGTRSTRAMSLCETELASPSSQKMVTSLQDVPVTVPRSIVVAPQHTRSPTLSVLDWSPLIESINIFVDGNRDSDPFAAL